MEQEEEDGGGKPGGHGGGAAGKPTVSAEKLAAVIAEITKKCGARVDVLALRGACEWWARRRLQRRAVCTRLVVRLTVCSAAGWPPDGWVGGGCG